MNYTIKTKENRLIMDQTSLFNGYIDSDFRRWNLEEKIAPRKKFEVKIETITKNFKFSDIFTSPDTMVMSQEEIISFVEQNTDTLFPKKYEPILFLTKSHKKFFVVRVDLDDGERNVRVRRIDSDWRGYWWFAGVRKSSDLGHSELSETLPLHTSIKDAIKLLKDNGYIITKEF